MYFVPLTGNPPHFLAHFPSQLPCSPGVTAKATANAHVHTVPHKYGLTRVANSAKF